ncbi:MAG: hypothetical protein IJT98_03810 [Prevotella sp.]|nr:hypothetical protein [Prevotella sp.]
MKPREKDISQRVTLFADGKYHWRYDVNMYTNYSILIDVYKAMGISAGITGLIVFLIVACAGGLSVDGLLGSLQTMLIVAGIFAVLCPLGYLLYALIMGGKYEVLFTMDEQQVVHEQSAMGARKAKKIGTLTSLAGAAAGRPGVAGAGMMSASRTKMVTTLTDVRRLIPCRGQHLIKVNERLSKNRVYVCDEDFDFVYRFLCEHCPNAE